MCSQNWNIGSKKPFSGPRRTRTSPAGLTVESPRMPGIMVSPQHRHLSVMVLAARLIGVGIVAWALCAAAPCNAAGDEARDKVVSRGLDWLAKKQSRRGSWSVCLLRGLSRQRCCPVIALGRWGTGIAIACRDS